MAEVVLVGDNHDDNASARSSAASTSGEPCLIPVGSIVRLQGLAKAGMNGQLGTIQAITPGSQKAVVGIKGQHRPVVVSARHITEAFPLDMVVYTPGEPPQVAVVLGTANRKVSVVIMESGEKVHFEPEQLIILEEIE